MQAGNRRDLKLLELAEDTCQVAEGIGDPAICARLHEIARELQEWAAPPPSD
jgi:hypothetical protein